MFSFIKFVKLSKKNFKKIQLYIINKKQSPFSYSKLYFFKKSKYYTGISAFYRTDPKG